MPPRPCTRERLQRRIATKQASAPAVDTSTLTTAVPATAVTAVPDCLNRLHAALLPRLQEMEQLLKRRPIYTPQGDDAVEHLRRWDQKRSAVSLWQYFRCRMQRPQTAHAIWACLFDGDGSQVSGDYFMRVTLAALKEFENDQTNVQIGGGWIFMMTAVEISAVGALADRQPVDSLPSFSLPSFSLLYRRALQNPLDGQRVRRYFQSLYGDDAGARAHIHLLDTYSDVQSFTYREVAVWWMRMVEAIRLVRPLPLLGAEAAAETAQAAQAATQAPQAAPAPDEPELLD